MTNTETIIQAIEEGLVDEGLTEIYQALHSRHRVIRARQQRQTMRSLRPGDRVEVFGNIKPKYMIGMQGTVQEKFQSKVLVHFDNPRGKFGTKVRVPASCLQRIEEDNGED